MKPLTLLLLTLVLGGCGKPYTPSTQLAFVADDSDGDHCLDSGIRAECGQVYVCQSGHWKYDEVATKKEMAPYDHKRALVSAARTRPLRNKEMLELLREGVRIVQPICGSYSPDENNREYDHILLMQQIMTSRCGRQTCNP